MPENLEATVVAVPILSMLLESLIRNKGVILRFLGATKDFDSFDVVSKSSLEGTINNPVLVPCSIEYSSVLAFILITFSCFSLITNLSLI